MKPIRYYTLGVVVAVFLAYTAVAPLSAAAQKFCRARDYGFHFGVMRPGPLNAVTDVPGVKVGHVTLIVADSIRTGVTAIVPHAGNIFRQKVPAAVFAGNGFGKLAGVTQIRELGNVETPVILTNTLSVAAGLEGLISYTLAQPGNEGVGSVNGVVGETNDGELNDIRGRHISPDHVLEAINRAASGPVREGNVGAGTGTICFGFKGGMGTASRRLPESMGGYTVGVIVQTNFGGNLCIDGVPAGRLLQRHMFKDALGKQDGSCMMVVITDAPVGSRNLERMAKRTMLGLARTGGIASNGSGDYAIALSVAPANLIDESTSAYTPVYLHNSAMSALFQATVEATEEAIINSLFAAEDMQGMGGRTVGALPVDDIVKWAKAYGIIE